MTRPTLLLRCTLPGLLAGIAVAASAQDQPAAFVHGFTSDGGTWSYMKPSLEGELQITGVNPTLGWPNS